MSSEQVETALRGATDTERVVTGAGVLASVGEVVTQAFADQPVVVVADTITHGVAGQEVQQRLEAIGHPVHQSYVFPAQPTLRAEYPHIERLRDSLRTHDAVPVAVGSGTINDIVKRAAHECGRPYLVVGTAASMDGYAAFGAAITKEGYKQTMSCPAPKVVVGDLEVIASAPGPMTASGYGDLLGKITAGADWLLADALEIEPVDDQVWSLVQGPLRHAIGSPAELRDGDLGALEGLVGGLVMSGLAMQAAASSRPASGAEHLFSHLWEMEGLGHDDSPPLSHGFKVAVGSIAIAALYERVLEVDLSNLDVDGACAAWPTRDAIEQAVRATHKTPGLDEAAETETLAKYVTAEDLMPRLELLRRLWPELRDRLHAQLLPAAELRRMLRAAGAPTSPGEIGLGAEEFRQTYTRAQMIRRRFTVLDLTLQAGILDRCVEELFGPGGFWDDAALAGTATDAKDQAWGAR